jgi:hypothetical protein
MLHTAQILCKAQTNVAHAWLKQMLRTQHKRIQGYMYMYTCIMRSAQTNVAHTAQTNTGIHVHVYMYYALSTNECCAQHTKVHECCAHRTNECCDR